MVFLFPMILIMMNSGTQAEFLTMPPIITDMEQVFRNISGITMTSCYMECSKYKICRGVGLSEQPGNLPMCHLLKEKANKTDEIPTTSGCEKKLIPTTKPPTVKNQKPMKDFYAGKVCYGGKMYGQFWMKRPGKLIGIYLIYSHGHITYESKTSRWGSNPKKVKELGTIITNEKNDVIFPSYVFSSKKQWYTLDKRDGNSLSFRLLYPDFGTEVAYGDEFRIWFVQDWLKKNDRQDYKTKTCAKVYYTFSV